MIQINNRRYLGSKYKLLPFIREITDKHCSDARSLMDVFGGTGVVAHHYNTTHDILVNDLLMSNVYSYKAFMGTGDYSQEKIDALLTSYNAVDVSVENYYSENFANTFLNKDNMRRVGYIRDDIDLQYSKGNITDREKAILITSLIYAIDKISNTVGHYDAYRRNGDLNKILTLNPLSIEVGDNRANIIECMDANMFAKHYTSDIVYIDPPYNSRQYCDAYHFLENVATNLKPEIKGVARKMDRTHLKSAYCTIKAPTQFEDLISSLDCKYILVSYNNTGEQINARSNAKISDEQLVATLQKKGKVTVFEKDFGAFTTGKTKLDQHKERIFLCEVGKQDKAIKPNATNNKCSNTVIKSPLNYTGGKGKLFPQIKAKLPQDIDNFYDIFCGGANVGINVKANKVVCVDKNEQLIKLLNFLKESEFEQLHDKLLEKISYYNLSDSFANGYDAYGCDSSNGLGSYNKVGFLRLREDYNTSQDTLLFLLLIFYSFNNQIRFNANSEFNLPVGKRDYNASLRKKLKAFMSKVQASDISFVCKDFRQLDVPTLVAEKAFLYLDPPYILGTASYNENGGWTEEDEIDLLDFLLKCNQEGLQFALSNVLKHKGLVHERLLSWCVEHGFNINHLNYNYSNSSYQGKNIGLETQEVLITNYL